MSRYNDQTFVAWHLIIGIYLEIGVWCLVIRFPLLVIGFYPSSFFFNAWFTISGFALPLLAFITWPTKKPKSFSLPAL